MLSVFLMTLPAAAAIINVTGTVRDFNDDHPDMEGVISGLVTGLVSPNLAADKNPDYIGSGGGDAASGSIDGTASFDQWYENVAGVNLPALLTIPLDNTITPDPSVYTFISDAFFPIDGVLFDNQGRSHNYHFTYEIHTQFTYRAGQEFSFEGDDDLWLFIDDALVLDLGGVHGVLGGMVDLDSLGLTVGNTYDFDLFFAERHTTQSNFRIDTSIPAREAPEPATMLLITTGLIGFAGFRRKFLK